ncbi:RHS repeat-associated core domain-containing protein [Parapedobacter sp. DT-150]|uniref:RHS repeat-associated core domain-containing protein n=1 Tax=Parapedobacter sp. DT-150 TaxID=3396162 RepID=UPI003F1B5341
MVSLMVVTDTYSYDRNGNIRTLARTDASAAVADNLTLNYTGNRLTSVVDAITATADVNYQLPGTTAYSYDANGNMDRRYNGTSGRTANNIDTVIYNYLNLPQSVTAAAGNATYVYDATGRKLRSTGGLVGQARDYIDGIEYSGGTMELIHTEEGRIIRSGTAYTYHYFLRDHLGNNRAGFQQGTNVTTPNFTADYYPFGLQYRQYIRAGSPKNNYLYNGKELQDGIKQYDYGARFYDPVLGRWGSVDPLAESFQPYSPYNYTLNNPMRFIDPNGMWVDDYYYNEEEEIEYVVQNDQPDRHFVSDSEGEYSEVGYNELSQDMRQDYSLVSSGIQSGDLGFDEGVLSLGSMLSTGTGQSGGDMKGFYLSLLGYGLDRTSNKMFNKNTWYSLHQWKTYSQKFNGNQYTGGKNAHGRTISRGFTGIGYGLGIYNAYSVEQQYSNGQINIAQRWTEQVSNVISTGGGVHGAAWGIGWEIGRTITNIPGYHENVRVPAQRFLGIRP